MLKGMHTFQHPLSVVLHFYAASTYASLKRMFFAYSKH